MEVFFDRNSSKICFFKGTVRDTEGERGGGGFYTDTMNSREVLLFIADTMVDHGGGGGSKSGLKTGT